MGADDYLVKPFAFSELMARMNSLFRRKSSFRPEAPSFGDLVLESDGHRLCCGSNSCRLSRTEYDLMNLLVLAGGSVTARSVLLHKIWGLDTDVEDGNLDNYIYFLQKHCPFMENLQRYPCRTMVRASRTLRKHRSSGVLLAAKIRIHKKAIMDLASLSHLKFHMPTAVP